ncbi:MAG: Crp/Fnr family transcriptional regulator [Chlamydiota bacterium]|nr:Crp/Fnr family transcriptional regulator [Chlamydiota bacterium]
MRKLELRIEDIDLFNGLKSIEINDIKKYIQIKRFEKGDLLFREGNACQNIFIVKSGRVKLFSISKDGKEQILDILEPGDNCACHPAIENWCCGSIGEVMIESVLWIISRKHFSDLLQQKHLVALKLSSILANRLKDYASMLEKISLEDVEQRLVRYLLKQAQRKGMTCSNGIFFNLTLTRSELASFIGSARETIIRNLYNLQKKELISIHNSYITVLDVKGMEAILKT